MVLEENGEDKMLEKVTNEQVLERIGEKRTLLNNILSGKANLIGHILRRNRLLHDFIEVQMEVKGVGRRRTQLLDDLRNRRKYWELKEEAGDGNESLAIAHKEYLARAHLCCYVGRYHAEQQLFLLFLLALQLYPGLDAGPRAHEGVVVCRLCHVAVVEPRTTGTHQEHRLRADLQVRHCTLKSTK